jgi:hypothetical protein
MRVCEVCGKDISSRPEGYTLCWPCWLKKNKKNINIQQIWATATKEMKNEIRFLMTKGKLTTAEKNILEEFLLISTEKISDKEKIYMNIVDLCINFGIILSKEDIADKTNLSLEEIEEYYNKYTL